MAGEIKRFQQKCAYFCVRNRDKTMTQNEMTIGKGNSPQSHEVNGDAAAHH